MDAAGRVTVSDPPVSTLQAANSETGIVQDLPEGLAVSDWTQGFGKLPMAFEEQPTVVTDPPGADIDYYLGDESNRVMIEILDGLNETDVIVVVGHSNLRDGSKVLASSDHPNSFTG